MLKKAWRCCNGPFMRPARRSKMPVIKSETLPIRNQNDVVAVRQATRIWSTELGFRLVDITKMVTAASELARNALDHGGGGQATLENVREGGKVALRITFEDRGPGIPDINRAMQDHYTTGNGMGMGLGGSKRLVNEFEIESTVGKGTRVTIMRWK
jgi:serine/threonine-protein kinase RsbT